MAKKIVQACECEGIKNMIDNEDIYIGQWGKNIYRKDDFKHSPCNFCQQCGQPLKIEEEKERSYGLGAELYMDDPQPVWEDLPEDGQYWANRINSEGDGKVIGELAAYFNRLVKLMIKKEEVK